MTLTPTLALHHIMRLHKQNKPISPKLVSIILTNPFTSYMYAKVVVKGRFVEGESIILKNPVYAFKYAKNILKQRWTKAESIISSVDNLSTNI